jgi:hypothetical protein
LAGLIILPRKYLTISLADGKHRCDHSHRIEARKKMSQELDLRVHAPVKVFVGLIGQDIVPVHGCRQLEL